MGAGLEKPLEKVVLHSFPVVCLCLRKVLYRIPQRTICSDNIDVWPGTRWYCTSSEQTSKHHDELADQSLTHFPSAARLSCLAAFTSELNHGACRRDVTMRVSGGGGGSVQYFSKYSIENVIFYLRCLKSVRNVTSKFISIYSFQNS